MRKILAVGAAAVMAVGTAEAGLKLVERGDLTALQTVKSFAVVMDYEGLLVGKKWRYTEEQYFQEKSKDLKQQESWQTAKEGRYPERFLDKLNATMKKKGAVASVNAEQAPYTIRVKTVLIEPGYNVGISRRPALVDFIVTIEETENPENVVAMFEFAGCPGRDVMGYDFDLTYRVSEAYAKLGKDLGKYLAKKVLR